MTLATPRNRIVIILLSSGCLFALYPAPASGNAQLPAMNQQTPSDVANRIVVEVTAVSGDSIYLNQGRAAGLLQGDKVIVSLADGSEQTLFIDSISRGSSRCVSAEQNPFISAGLRGTAYGTGPTASSNPANPAEPSNLPQAKDLAPALDRPEWRHPPEQWSSDQPLLAPARSLAPHERETKIYGQFFSQYLHTWNWASVDNQYSFGRIGTDLWIENPFGDGARVRFRGDLDSRGVNLFDGIQAVDTVGRVSLLSYAWGGLDQQPLRWEIGRFLPSEFPEFGFLDGAEWIYQATSRQRVGFSVGAMPEPFPSFQSWDDLQAAVFYRFASDDSESFCFGTGYQKTWHDGNPDRDLVVFKADFHPHAAFHAHGTIWTDYYGSADTLKSKHWEITEALFNQSLIFSPVAGMGTYYVQLRWPQLLRREIDPIFALQILRNRRSSYGAYAWRDLGPQLRLNGRVDRWQNQDSLGGTTWETELYFRQLGGGPTDLALAFLATDGLYVSGPGGRVTLTRYFPRGLASLTYTAGDYRLTDNAQRLMSQAVVTTLDFYFSSGHSYSLFGDYRFGESEDAASLGIIWRKRF